MTSIDILQSSNDSGARNFSEENIADEKPARVDVSSKESGQTEVEEGDSFFANVPKDLTISDLIIDKGKFKSIEEQREYFEKEMLELANDKEGWTLFGKTNAEVDDSDQLDIYAKTVDWSPVRCMRTSVKERHVGPVEAMDYFQHVHKVMEKDRRRAISFLKASTHVQKAARNVWRPFVHMTETVLSFIQYRIVQLPCGYKQSRIDAYIYICRCFCIFARELNINLSARLAVWYVSFRAHNKSLWPCCK